MDCIVVGDGAINIAFLSPDNAAVVKRNEIIGIE